MTTMKTALGGVRRAIVAGAAALVASLALVGAAHAQNGEEPYILNMDEADIGVFIEDVGRELGYNFIVHPMVKGKVTVFTSEPLSRQDLFEVFLSTLRVHGFTAVPASNGTYRVIPDQTAAEETAVFGGAGVADDQFVTDIIRLRYFDAVEAAKAVKPLVNGRGQVTANPDSNVLIVVDYSSNIQRIRQIVAEMDQDRSVIETVALQNLAASDMAQILNSLRGSRDTNGDFVVVPVETGNAVLIRGDSPIVGRLVALARSTDLASEPSETLKVIYLKHAEAIEIVPVLEQVARTLGFGENDLTIPFHEPTNSIILSADPNTVRDLERVVSELDIRRAQVQVEAIIVEVTDDTARELGFQFLIAGDEDSTVPFAVTNFSNSAPNLLALSGALLTSETSDTAGPVGDLQDLAVSSLLGINGFGFGVGGETDDGLFGVILNAVDNDTSSNILSTPSVVTTDNVAARLSVGQEIPITTGEVLGNANTNPFRTIERKEVGVQLEVLPQITAGDSIRLEIRQEVSSVFGPISAASSELITNKREIETTVLADDGEVIVLGGLIEESESLTASKVPLLGDIPIGGRLFRSDGRESVRTNLMVFIRPTILRDRSDVQTATSRKYDFAGQQTGTLDDLGMTALDAFVRQSLGADAAPTPPRPQSAPVDAPRRGPSEPAGVETLSDLDLSDEVAGAAAGE